MNKVIRYIAPAAAILAAARPVFAQNFGVPQPEGFNITDLGLMISRAISVALVAAAILVFVYLVWGGIQWITSGGDKAKTEEARSRITSALIGLAVVAASWAIMELVSTFFGIDIEEGTVPQAF